MFFVQHIENGKRKIGFSSELDGGGSSEDWTRWIRVRADYEKPEMTAGHELSTCDENAELRNGVENEMRLIGNGGEYPMIFLLNVLGELFPRTF